MKTKEALDRAVERLANGEKVHEVWSNLCVSLPNGETRKYFKEVLLVLNNALEQINKAIGEDPDAKDPLGTIKKLEEAQKLLKEAQDKLGYAPKIIPVEIIKSLKEELEKTITAIDVTIGMGLLVEVVSALVFGEK